VICRLAGVITDRPAEEARAMLSTMIASLLHDRFVSYGTHCVPELGCYLGWVSDDDGGDVEPEVDETGRVLIFAGEDFSDNGAATRATKSNSGGDRWLRELNGWFAGVLLDAAKKQIVLFNDRYGLHRVYYAQSRGMLTFASEAKALLASHPRTRKLNPTAMGEFVAYGTVLHDRTLFEDVFVLPAGSAWTIESAAAIAKRRYFTPQEWEAQSPLTTDEFCDRLESTLSTVVPRYFSGPRQVAVSLTGGVDTRLVMAFADRARDVRSYTFSGMYRDCFDVRIARTVASACGCNHETLRLDPEFLQHFPTYAEKTIWSTDGTLDVGAAHEVYLTARARRIAPVRLTGNYGSEILRGASTFKPLSWSARLFQPDFVPHIQEAHRSFAGIVTGHQVSFAAFREIPWHLGSRLHVGQSQLNMRSPYMDNDLVALTYQAPLPVRQTPELWDRLLLRRNRHLASIPTDRGRVAGAGPLANVPNRFYNYALFKAEWYHQTGMPHWLAPIDRRVSQALRPLFFMGSHKIEHYRTWFRDALFPYLDSIVRESKETPYINAAVAADMLAAHREGRGNFVADINRIITIGLIDRLLIRQIVDRIDRKRTIEFDSRLHSPRQIAAVR
jgi:asparagine synthase (glutamine-hydrolysing)